MSEKAVWNTMVRPTDKKLAVALILKEALDMNLLASFEFRSGCTVSVINGSRFAGDTIC